MDRTRRVGNYHTTELIGKRFGRLTVLSRNEYNHVTPSGCSVGRWNCLCKCGNRKVVAGVNLRNGLTKSCGCLKRESLSKIAIQHNTTHGGSYTKLYNVWRGILKRCQNPKNKDYHRYGQRGIKVCKRWMSFENFREDMGNPPNGMLIDRINNDGNYTPRNCRWVTPKVSSNNRRKRSC